METTLLPAVRAAFDRLIDYAGLFPPAKLDMPAALAEYARCRASAQAWMLGPFIVPASRIDELLALVVPGAAALPLSVIVDAGTDARAWLGHAGAILERIAALAANDARIDVVAIEIPLPTLLSKRDTYEAMIGQCAALLQKHGLRYRPAYVEFPRDDRYDELLVNTIEVLRRYAFHGKIRCGGVTADAFPSPHELARYIHADREHGGGFKATAGLHHPVRQYNEAVGVTMHGFLNILVAAAVSDAYDADALIPILEDQDSSHFSIEGEGLRYRGKLLAHEGELKRAREHFISYGSCSFSEPVDDLINLRLLPKD